MTHSGYLNETGGFLENNAPARIYEIAASMGVSEFVVPGNKPDKVLQYKN